MRRLIAIMFVFMAMSSAHGSDLINEKDFSGNPGYVLQDYKVSVTDENPSKEEGVFVKKNLLIYSVIIKAAGFGVMSLANHRENECMMDLSKKTNYKIDNKILHDTGFFIFAVSIPLDGIYLFK